MTQDFLISMDRVKHEDKGHSKKEPRVDVKSKFENGKPAITSFTKNNIKVFDSVKKYIDIPYKIKMETKLNLDIRWKRGTTHELTTIPTIRDTTSKPSF